MIIGVLKEIKKCEYRIGLTPYNVKELVRNGNKVLIETTAGNGVGFSDQMYINSGGTIVSKDRLYEEAELIIKVKEPLKQEYKRIKENQILFAYLHLAPDYKQTKGLLESNCIAIAYETITDDFGTLPLLRPMSEIAGRMSIQAGTYSLQKTNGGSGVLLPGVVGVNAGNVLIVGGGVVGINAARVAIGMGAKVTIADISLKRLSEIDSLYGSKITTRLSNIETIEELLATSDLVIGAVLIPGGSAPKLITKDMLKLLKVGSAFVDVAIDQGGSAETSKPTTHESPTYIEEGIVHYCVTNMPGAVAKTSTIALTNATLPYIQEIAKSDIKQLLLNNKHIRNGVNVFKGKLTNEPVAKSLSLPFQNLSEEIIKTSL